MTARLAPLLRSGARRLRAAAALSGGGAGSGGRDAAHGRGRADRGPGRLAGPQQTDGPAGRDRQATAHIGSRSSSTTISPASASAATAPRRASGGRCARATGWSDLRAARWCSTRPPDPTPASTSSAPNMRPSPPSRPRSSAVRRDRRPDRRPARRSTRRARPAGEVKASQGQHRPGASTSPTADVRFYLFHGPDEAQSRALGERLLKALGASRFVLAAGAVKADPALLADEAGAMSLFGGAARDLGRAGRRRDRRRASRRCSKRRRCESPVIAIAGALRKTSALLKLAEASPNAAGLRGLRRPRAQDAERMVIEVGRALRPAHRAPRGGADRRRLRQRPGDRRPGAAKFALYVDASPQAPKELDHDAVDAVGADVPEGDLLRLADLALSGELAELADELARLPPAARGDPGHSRAAAAVADAGADAGPGRAGEALDAVMTSIGKSLFWKDKPLVEQAACRQWDAKGWRRLPSAPASSSGS